MANKKRKQRELEEIMVSVLFKDWHGYYRFGLAEDNGFNYEDIDGHFDLMIIDIECQACEDIPSIKLFKGDIFKLNIEFEHKLRVPPPYFKYLGHVYRDKDLGFYTSATLPKNSVPYVLQLLSSDKVKEVILFMTTLRYNKGYLKSFSLDTNPEDV